jgi:hypothetical protein
MSKALFPAGGKPLDFGAGGISGCLNRSGRITALNMFHPQHGYVALTSAPPYPDADRYDANKVRAYRRQLLSQAGIGLAFAEEPQSSYVRYAGDVPVMRLTFADGTFAECATITYPPYGCVQIWQFSQLRDISFSGRVWVQRNVYVQLTEGGPLPPVSASTHHFSCTEAGVIGLENPALPFAVCIGAIPGMQTEMQDDGSVIVQAADSAQTTLTIFTGMGQDRAAAQAAIAALQSFPHSFPPDDTTDPLLSDPLEERAWRYTHICTVPVNEHSTCLLTDHMILPLSWNRDGYYAARLLLTREQYYPSVRQHLTWMFETAERVNGLWGRSYLANGTVKDRGFQLDQQLFPLLELTDYVQISGDTSVLERFRAQIAPLFEQLQIHRAPHALLYATDETPADDRIALPYPLSSHVLMWRVLRQLQAIGYTDPLPVTPEEIAASIQRYFSATPPHSTTPIYAYATDGNGQHHFYHDANDIPLVLMPAWGFCMVDDELWKATIAFAFSDANRGGFYAPALGSVHTAAPWSLGDVQEWILTRLTGDTDHEQVVLRRMQGAAQWDGSLPEAYDADTGAVVSRNWFLWPSVAYACVKNGVFDDNH